MLGNKNSVLGSDNNVSGSTNSIQGGKNNVYGGDNQVIGQNNFVDGGKNSVQGSGNVVMSLDDANFDFDDFFNWKINADNTDHATHYFYLIPSFYLLSILSYVFQSYHIIYQSFQFAFAKSIIVILKCLFIHIHR